MSKEEISQDDPVVIALQKAQTLQEMEAALELIQTPSSSPTTEAPMALKDLLLAMKEGKIRGGLAKASI